MGSSSTTSTSGGAPFDTGGTVASPRPPRRWTCSGFAKVSRAACLLSDEAGKGHCMSSRRRDALAGAVAAAVALGAGELVAGLDDGGPSLVTAIGDEIIDRFAGSLKDLAVELFGTNDKAALV